MFKKHFCSSVWLYCQYNEESVRVQLGKIGWEGTITQWLEVGWDGGAWHLH